METKISKNASQMAAEEAIDAIKKTRSMKKREREFLKTNAPNKKNQIATILEFFLAVFARV